MEAVAAVEHFFTTSTFLTAFMSKTKKTRPHVECPPRMSSTLYSHLSRYSPADWAAAVDTLSASVHPIDKDATKIWFTFFPLGLHLTMAAAEDEVAVARQLRLQGRWRLVDQIDTSHKFLFAHRYWPQAKLAVQNATGPFPDSLPALVSAIADAASRTARLDREFLIGICAVALMTLRQVGPDALVASPGGVHLPEEIRALSAHQVLKARARDDSQGMLGFLRGNRKEWTVTFDETDPTAAFTVINDEEIASAAKRDQRDHRSRDPRCTPGEGPIPVECRAASCGTCWVGVLGGAEKLSPVNERDERKRMLVFGYIDTTEARPIIRLACQAKAFGAVSVVIPPWNGFLSKQA